MWNSSIAILGSLSACLLATPVLAIERAEVVRVDDAHVRVTWVDNDPAAIFVLDEPSAPAEGTEPLFAADADGEAVIALPADRRRYVVLRDGGDGSLFVAAEREVALQRGSNFRDIGGYLGAEGKRVAWGRIFRSGALPMLSERDYDLLGVLDLTTIVDLRSLEERIVAPDLLDDRTGALFVSNDYSIVPMLASMRPTPGKAMYAGTETSLAPQYRALFRRLLANDGATMYHCSAGQDRTGIATALILSALGVDRATILADYHLSTALRRPQNEMPQLDPAKFPGNPIVALYAKGQARPGGMQAEPLFTADGQSHLAQFFDYLDAEYGGVEPYLAAKLGIGRDEIVELRRIYLD